MKAILSAEKFSQPGGALSGRAGCHDPDTGRWMHRRVWLMSLRCWLSFQDFDQAPGIDSIRKRR
jgi:hypothetical protein